MHSRDSRLDKNPSPTVLLLLRILFTFWHITHGILPVPSHGHLAGGKLRTFLEPQFGIFGEGRWEIEEKISDGIKKSLLHNLLTL
jgi:hypothetical protein